MQVCLNDHTINDGVRKFPEYNKEYCNKCGEKTVTKCPICNTPIPGELEDTGVTIISGYQRTPPKFCEKCGEPYPWTDINFNGEEKKKSLSNNTSDILKSIFANFHNAVKELRRRYSNRNTIDVNDEYDVQDLMSVFLRVHFNDVRKEEYTPSYAGKSSRTDFLLKEEKVVIETKMTRKGLADKELGDQLLIDIGRYKSHPDCDTLICFVYDPEGRIVNPDGLSKDLESQSRDTLKVTVYINP